MWRHLFFCCALAGGMVSVAGLFDKLISKGRWLVESFEKCQNAEQYPLDFGLRKKKLNRTHDGFEGDMNLPFPIDTDIGIHIEACKKVDGGCKLMQVFSDRSLCRYLMRHAEQNFKKGLVMSGLEPHCPIPAGHHQMIDYVFDYTELPEDGMIGDFKATVFVTKGLKKLACMVIGVGFKKFDT